MPPSVLCSSQSLVPTKPGQKILSYAHISCPSGLTTGPKHMYISCCLGLWSWWCCGCSRRGRFCGYGVRAWLGIQRMRWRPWFVNGSRVFTTFSLCFVENWQLLSLIEVKRLTVMYQPMSSTVQQDTSYYFSTSSLTHFCASWWLVHHYTIVLVHNINLCKICGTVVLQLSVRAFRCLHFNYRTIDLKSPFL